ncbi:MAG TPA: protein kinase family protein [Nocardioidaceae bacterium]|nr:protein kinase family protein [Nocardioidaceae bacterium]
MTVEPGRLLAGRYRVEELLTDRAGARSWRAVDEMLRRSVAVDVISADAPRADALINAARRSAAVTDSRFLRVLDASHENGDAYVVREWARGEQLERLLADGPLTHRRAAWVVREVAEALGSAHRAGIYHWRLVPENIIITETGAVRIIGLATDAALSGLRYANSEAESEDVRGLGRLLYATLVTRWPGGPDCSLQTAPSEHGRLLRPRQVRAGVPRPLDEICDRILGDPPRHNNPRLRTVDEITAALADAAGLTTDHSVVDPEQTAIAGMRAFDDDTEHPPRRADGRIGVGVPAGPPPAVLPPTSAAGPQPTTARHSGAGAAGAGHGAAVGADRTAIGTVEAYPGPARRRIPGGRRWSWVLFSLVIALCAVAAFLIGFSLNADTDSEPAGAPTTAQSTPAQPVQIADVTAWDPFGEDGENDEQAPLANDGDPTTSWTTLTYYGQAQLGGLKPGVGLILDLGEAKDVSEVRVNLGGNGTDFDVLVAPGDTDQPPARLDAYQVQGSATDASGPTDVQLNRPVTTRYVVVWLTSLAADGNDFSGRVHEVSVIG